MKISKIIKKGVELGITDIIRKSPDHIANAGMYLLAHKITISNNNSRGYLKTNEWIFNNIKSKSIHKKAKIDRDWINGEEVYLKTVGLGKFTVYENGTLYVIDHRKEEKNAYEEYQLTINIMGKGAEAIYKDIIHYSLKKNTGDKIGIKIGYSYKMVQKRDFDTIYCEDSIKESVINELDRFAEQRAEYIKLGIPYKIGMLFHGKPGTGKTSMAKAIATYTNRDIHVINMSNLKNLSDILREVKEKDILLIEEIDTIVRNRVQSLSDEELKVREKKMAEAERNGEEFLEDTPNENVENRENVQLGNLLNLIDGVATPENIIVIATTNHIEALDEALIREGRFDFKYEMKYLTKEKCQEVFDEKNFNKDVLETLEYPLAPCKLQLEILKQFKNRK